MNIRYVFKTICFVLAICCGLSTVQLTAAPPPGKGGGNGGGGGGGDGASIQYSISVAPTPSSITSLHLWSMNSLGMVLGEYGVVSAGHHPFIYDASGTYIDFRAEPDLTDQVDALKPGFRFDQAFGINNFGDVVGYLYDPSTDMDSGFYILTGGSLDVSTWMVGLLPDLESDSSGGTAINDMWDVVGTYRQLDGARDRFFYNLLQGGNAVPYGLSNVGANTFTTLNNLQQVAASIGETVFLFEGTVLVDVLDIGTSYVSLNDSGILAGIKNSQKIGGKGKAYDIAFQYSTGTGQTENVVLSRPYTLSARGRHFLNNSGDMGYQKDGNSTSGRIELAHRGFSPGFTPQVLNIDELIADGDPWRDDVIAAWGTGLSILGISDRSDSDDASGYPQIVASVSTLDGRKCMVLTPHDSP